MSLKVWRQTRKRTVSNFTARVIVVLHKCLFVCLFCLFVCMFVSLSVCPLVCLYVCHWRCDDQQGKGRSLTIKQGSSVCCVSVCLSVCSSVIHNRSICMFVRLSVRIEIRNAKAAMQRRVSILLKRLSSYCINILSVYSYEWQRTVLNCC